MRGQAGGLRPAGSGASEECVLGRAGRRLGEERRAVWAERHPGWPWPQAGREAGAFMSVDGGRSHRHLVPLWQKCLPWPSQQSSSAETNTKETTFWTLPPGQADGPGGTQPGVHLQSSLLLHFPPQRNSTDNQLLTLKVNQDAEVKETLLMVYKSEKTN